MKTDWKRKLRPLEPGVRWLVFSLGLVLIACGLELFLTPNRIVPGGVKGISVILSHVTEMQMGFFLLLINVPFVVLFKRDGDKRRLLLALVGLSVVAGLAIVLHPYPPLLEHPLAAAVIGGLTLGGGLGLAIRTGGYADGISEAAVRLKKKLPLSVSELIMIVNLLLLSAAGFVFGWQQALYSIVAYYAAYQALRVALTGHRRYWMVWIQCRDAGSVRKGIVSAYGDRVTFLSPGDTAAGGELMAVVESRHRRPIRELAERIDDTAAVRMTPIDAQDEAYYWS